ncbi:MAG: fibronectin type III domain-containing protein, partial [Calditrichaeota bacterium]|nr:fibronectin type III domain-containing protein [Calditrichota bacterium]
SDFSPLFSISTLIENLPPSAPQNLTAIAGYQMIRLQWNANPATETDFSHYIVYSGVDDTDLQGTAYLPGRTDTSYLAINLQDNSDYFFRIQAFDSADQQSPYSQTISAHTFSADEPPSVPQNLSATAGYRSVLLNWTPNPSTEIDFDHYVIYVGYDEDHLTATNWLANRTDSSYLVTGLVGGEYFFQITAVDMNGHVSDFSPMISAITLPTDEAPTVPQNLIAIPGDHSIEIRWSANPKIEFDFDHYIVYSGLSRDNLQGAQCFANRTDTSCIFTGLLDNSVYYFAVQAFDNTQHQSGFSTVISAVTSATSLQLDHFLVQNPVLTDYLTLYLKSNLAVETIDSASITFSNSSTALGYTVINGNPGMQVASFKTSGEGQYDLYINAGIAGLSQTIERSYNLVNLNAKVASRLALADQKTSLEIPAEAVLSKQIVIGSIEMTNSTNYQVNFQTERALLKAARLSISFERTANDPGKYVIYQEQADDWQELATQVYDRNGRLEAVIQTNQLGRFRLIYDANRRISNLVPNDYALKQNYPNPFNPSTTVVYDLPHDGHVQLIIYNILGQQIRQLVNEDQLAAGNKTVHWDGRDQSGKPVASGVYIYQLLTREYSASKRMLLVK